MVRFMASEADREQEPQLSDRKAVLHTQRLLGTQGLQEFNNLTKELYFGKGKEIAPKCVWTHLRNRTEPFTLSSGLLHSCNGSLFYSCAVGFINGSG
ncbi:unnamed protein product [Pleuronectes platessa]|uniref:Uncharacterized protein n=1 Tax=Pleuronectes platessa TaxID=8262 RepID=A0A9N7Z1K4_PLEPL|nr:unnamed protein product [Pleuronectes platessa]